MLVYGLQYYEHKDTRVDWAAQHFAATNLQLGGAFATPADALPYESDLGTVEEPAPSTEPGEGDASGAPEDDGAGRRLIRAAGGCLTFDPDPDLSARTEDGALDVGALTHRRVVTVECEGNPTWWSDSAEGHLVLDGTD